VTRALHRRAAHALGGVLVLATAAYALDAVHDLGTPFGGSYYNAVILGCVVLAAWRGLAVRDDRAAWLLTALGLGCWLAGDVWWVMHADATGVPIPSLGDALYLGMYPPLATALVLLVRRRIGTASRMLALDGMIAAFAVSAVSAALVLEPVIAGASGTTAAMAVTIAYPICDIVLVGVLVEAVALGGWVLSRGWALLAAGLAAFAVMEGIYYAQVAQGAYVESGILDVGWLVALLLVAFAAWEPAPRPAPARRPPAWRSCVRRCAPSPPPAAQTPRWRRRRETAPGEPGPRARGARAPRARDPRQPRPGPHRDPLGARGRRPRAGPRAHGRRARRGAGHDRRPARRPPREPRVRARRAPPRARRVVTTRTSGRSPRA
jgi:hypothetical protein